MLLLLSRKRNERVRRHNAQLRGESADPVSKPERRVSDVDLFQLAGVRPRVITRAQ